MLNRNAPVFFVYILKCSNGSLYTGYTTDIKRRYQEHLNGSAKCKYTRSFPPIKIAACWKLEDASPSLAIKIELFIKRLPIGVKRKLVKNTEQLITLLGQTDIEIKPIKTIV